MKLADFDKWDELKKKADENTQNKIPVKEGDCVAAIDDTMYHFETLGKRDAFIVGLAFGNPIEKVMSLSYKHEPLTEQNKHRLNEIHL